MPPPPASATLERLWDRLPEVYRLVDETVGWDLFRYLSVVVDQAGELETLLDRMIAGELADPDTADRAWLVWLGQLVGVEVTPNLSDLEARDAIRYASSGWRAGTKAAVADAAKSVLTGSRYARVYDHATSRNTAGQDGVWDVLIVTRPSETPDVTTVLDAVVRKGAKPAGVVLHHEAYSATWGLLATARPTWADWHAAGTWRDLEETV